MPDSGQEHTADGDNGVLGPATGFDMEIMFCDFRVFIELCKAITTCTRTDLR